MARKKQKRKKAKKPPEAAIFWDLENTRSATALTVLSRHAKAVLRLVRKNGYEPCKGLLRAYSRDWDRQVDKFLKPENRVEARKTLREHGFSYVAKPGISDETILAQIEFVLKRQEPVALPRLCVFVTADGDFQKCAQDLRKRGRIVWAVSRNELMNKLLRDTVDVAYTIHGQRLEQEPRQPVRLLKKEQSPSRWDRLLDKTVELPRLVGTPLSWYYCSFTDSDGKPVRVKHAVDIGAACFPGQENRPTVALAYFEQDRMGPAMVALEFSELHADASAWIERRFATLATARDVENDDARFFNLVARQYGLAKKAVRHLVRENWPK